MGEHTRVCSHLKANMTINEVWHKSLLNPDIVDSVDSKLGDMAAKIAIQHFDLRYATLLFFNSTIYYGVELFLHAFNYNILLNRDKFNRNLTKLAKHYVIFGNEVTDLQTMLNSLKYLQIKNNGIFVFVCQPGITNCDEKEMTSLFWEYKIVDVVIVKIEEEEAVGYTYFPISDGQCNNVKPIKLQLTNDSQQITTNQGAIFGRKFMKLSYCPLIVSSFQQTPYMNIVNGIPSGADGDLLSIIAYGLNTSIKMMTPHRGSGWGFQQKDGSWTGSLADIYYDLANISITSSVLSMSRFYDFDTTRSYYIKHVGWVTHPAILRDEATKLMHPLGSITRIVLIFSYIIVVLCAFIVKSKKWLSVCRKIGGAETSRSIAFFSWMICMGQPVIKLPTKSTFLQITILWIFYCFLIRTAYQVYLISSLKGNFYEKQIDTIEDGIKENYPFGGAASLQDYYVDYPEIFNEWIIVDTSEIIPTVSNISKGQKFVLAMNMDTAKIVITKQKFKVHILPQAVVSSPTVIFLKKYSPLTESLNAILDRIIASGFSEKSVSKYIRVKLVDGESGGEQEPLKMIHLSACYMLLLTGWILSFIFFLVEIYFGRVYRHPILPP